MKGVFVNWTKPYQERARLRGHAFKMQREQKSEEYITTDEELLFTILSVGYWKEFNGKTKLFTDRDGLKYYVKKNKSLFFNDDLWISIYLNKFLNVKIESLNKFLKRRFFSGNKSIYKKHTTIDALIELYEKDRKKARNLRHQESFLEYKLYYLL